MVVVVVLVDVEEDEEDEEVEVSAIELFALCRLFVSMAMWLCVGTAVVSALRLERLAFLDFLRVNLKPPASSPVVATTLGFTMLGQLPSQNLKSGEFFAVVYLIRYKSSIY